MENIMSMWNSVLLRCMVISVFMQSFWWPSTHAVNIESSGSASQIKASNLYQYGTAMDLYVYVSEQEYFHPVNNSETLVWVQKGLKYGDLYSGNNGNGTYSRSTQIPISRMRIADTQVQNNGPIYLHVFIIPGKSSDSSNIDSLKKFPLYRMKRLNKYEKRQLRRTYNLITGKTETSKEDLAKMAEGKEEEMISYWHPNITVNIVNNFTAWEPGEVPSPINKFIQFTPDLHRYKPILYINHFWSLKDYQPINKTVKMLDLTITFQPLSLGKWIAIEILEESKNVLPDQLRTDELEEFTHSVLPYLLELSTRYFLFAIAIASTIALFLGLVFSFLTTKNDIQFWNSRKSLEGLSVRLVFFNVFQYVIFLMYDNDPGIDDGFMTHMPKDFPIQITSFLWLTVEVWKITKVMDITLDRQRRVFGILPRLLIKDKGTKEYDCTAFKYLSMVLLPLAIIYFIYSIIYNEHKGWYSFILSNCNEFLLTFGFVMRIPQLFINYKLKSMAHLPWRMMTYSALANFFICTFTFLLTWSTTTWIYFFRNQFDFFICLYQHYIYAVDHTQVNKFGPSGQTMVEAENKENVISDQSMAIDSAPIGPDSSSFSVKGNPSKKQD